MNNLQVLRRVQNARQQYHQLGRQRWYEKLVLEPLGTSRLWICTPESENACHLTATAADSVLEPTVTTFQGTKVHPENGLCWFIYRKDDPAERIGSISLFQFTTPDVKLSSAALGYTLSEAHRRKGYMSEALCAIVRVAFEKLGLQRIEAQVRTTNERSRSVVQRMGFKLTGLTRKGKWSTEEELFKVVETEIWILCRKDWEMVADITVISGKL
jgi:RimJ/RimL family protein N-acetyltransferase